MMRMRGDVPMRAPRWPRHKHKQAVGRRRSNRCWVIEGLALTAWLMPRYRAATAMS